MLEDASACEPQGRSVSETSGCPADILHTLGEPSYFLPDLALCARAQAPPSRPGSMGRMAWALAGLTAAAAAVALYVLMRKDEEEEKPKATAKPAPARPLDHGANLTCAIYVPKRVLYIFHTCSRKKCIAPI